MAVLVLIPDISNVTIAFSIVLIAVASLTPGRFVRRHLTRDGRALAKRLKAYEAK